MTTKQIEYELKRLYLTGKLPEGYMPYGTGLIRTNLRKPLNFADKLARMGNYYDGSEDEGW